MVAALLVVASALPLVLRSPVWLEPFLRGPAIVDLESSFTGPVRREAGALVLSAGDGGSAELHTDFGGRARGGHYLLRLERAASAALAVSLFDPKTRRRIDGPHRRAAGSGFEVFMLRASEVPASTRLFVRCNPPGELRIADLQVRRVSPAYRWLPPVLISLAPALAVLFASRFRSWLLGRRAGLVAATARDRLAFLLAFLLIGFLNFYRAPVVQLADSQFISTVSQSLVTLGTVAMPDGFLAVDPQRHYQLERIGDRTVHYFSSAPAVLNAPVVWAYRLAGVRPVGDGGVYLRAAEIEVLRFAAALAAAGLCVLLYGIARRWLAAGPSLGLTVIFALGTQILSTISRPYWSHAWASVLLAGAVYLLVAPWARERSTTYLAIGSLLSWAFFCRPNLALSAVAITLLVAVRRRSYLPHLMASGLLWLGLLVVYSQSVFGEPLPPYLLSEHLESGRLGGGDQVRYLMAAVSTLVSPSRGLFIFVPMYALVLAVVVRRWGRLPSRALAVTALAVIAAQWQLLCFFRNWWGGASYGPRLFSDVVVWFFALAVLGLAATDPSARRRAVPWQYAVRLVAALAVAASLFINYRGAFAQATALWAKWAQRPPHRHADKAGSLTHGQRQALFQIKLWDWRDPQFLAGLLDRQGTGAPKDQAPPAGRAGRSGSPARGARRAKVRRLTAEVVGKGELRIAWSMSSAEATSYVVRVQPGNGRRFHKLAVVPGGARELVVRDLAPGAYTFRVSMRAGKKRLKLSRKLRVSLPVDAEKALAAQPRRQNVGPG